MRATRLATLLPPVLVGAIAAALGIWRLMPGVGYWDTAEFQTVAPLLGTAHPTGYPTYVILGWLASAILSPIGEAAVRMNALSALLVGASAAVTVDLARRLTGSTILAIVAGLGLAATPIVWKIGTHADPHALHLLFVAILLWLLVRWEDARIDEPERADRWLVGAAAVTGFAAGNHSLTTLLAIPIGLYVLAVEPGIVRRIRLVATCVVAVLVVTIAMYLELPLRGGAIPSLEAHENLVYGDPSTWSGFTYVATGEQFRGGISDPFGNLPRKVGELGALAARELGPLAALVVAGFVVTMVRRPAFGLLTGSAMAITCFFNAAYVNADIERYYLGPALIAWLWLAILAATVVDGMSGELAIRSARAPGAAGPAQQAVPTDAEPGPGPRRRLLNPYRLAAMGLAGLLLLAPSAIAFPARATAVDRTDDRSATLWLDAVLDELEPNPIVISWWSYSTSLWYAQHIQGRRPDVFIADDRTRLDLNMGDLVSVIDSNLAIARPVYVIRIDQNELRLLRERYNLTPLASPIARNVLRVQPIQTGAAR
ncbi:MAG TPA: DUF2723 domain-containing protein [Candidatus Limnocylindrales bacterium]